MMLMRNSVDSYHDMWYDKALQLAVKVGLKEAKPRTVGKQEQTNPSRSYLSITRELLPSPSLTILIHFAGTI